MNDIFYEKLRQEGVDESHIIKFAFDSAEDLLLIGEDLQDLFINKKKVDPKKFMTFISQRMIDNDMYYLLLDEVQNLGCNTGFKSCSSRRWSNYPNSTTCGLFILLIGITTTNGAFLSGGDSSTSRSGEYM